MQVSCRNFTRANGRHLTSATTGTSTYQYTYTADGTRTGKTVGSDSYTYYYADGKLRRQQINGGSNMDFFYDASGNPYAFKYDSTFYYYITNLQGDVVRIVESDGTVVATYKYDPWGKITSSTGTMASVNPLRYRGYYYDTETGFYYLMSRYYDPEIGRFINADALASTGQGIVGYNMFAYCNNNPLNNRDNSGARPEYTGDPQYEWIWEIGWWIKEQSDKDRKAIQDGEVVYESNGPGNGSHISNSHRIKTPWVMFEYIDENRTNDILGSTHGVVYEWVFHNIAYQVGSALGMESITTPAKDLDVGKTIFDDKRDPLSAKWFMSEFMKGTYFVFFPEQAINDFIIGCWWEVNNG